MRLSRSKGRLTSQGAAILRRARQAILAHPEAFHMRTWECGTTACIGGWCCRLLDWKPTNVMCTFDLEEKLVTYLGFTTRSDDLWDLFYDEFWSCDPTRAAERINAFLWSYGYPPDAIESAPEQAVEEPLVAVCAEIQSVNGEAPCGTRDQ